MKIIKDKNFTMKVVAAFFAIILWTYVMTDINPIIDKEIPNVNVELLNVDKVRRSNLKLMSPESVSITVKISGRRNEIYNIDRDDIVAQADLTGYQEGVHKVPIEIANTINSDKVEDYYPKSVLFEFDKIIEKQLPVNVNISGNIGKGHTVEKGTAKPNNVIIRGPRSWINSIKKVVATVNVTGASKDINTTVPFKVLDDKGNELVGVEKEPEIVEVYLPVKKVKDVPINPILKGEALNGYKVSNVISNPPLVRIKGYDKYISEVSEINTVPVDINFAKGDIIAETALEIPEGVQLMTDIDKPVVTVTVEEIKEKEFQYGFKDIDLRNLSSDLKIETLDEDKDITVTVKAVEKVIENIDKQDLVPYIDFNQLGEGEHRVDLAIDKPQMIEFINITPKSIKIELKDEKTNELKEEE